MHVVILCGGKGTRLAPLTDTLPKSLIDTKGRPFIDRQLDRWVAFGATRFTLLTGHLGEQICDSVGDFHRSVIVNYAHCEIEGTWSALRSCRPGDSREFLLTYGDVYPAQRPPPFGRNHLALIGRHGQLDIGAIWVRSDVVRIEQTSPNLNELWFALKHAGALGHYDSLPVHEIGSHEGLAKFNASL